MPEGNGSGPRKGGLEPLRADTVEQSQLPARREGCSALSLSDGWPSHFVSWHLGRTKDRLPQEETQEGAACVGAKRGSHWEIK